MLATFGSITCASSPPKLKSLSLVPLSCGNISASSARDFDSAYERGWSGGQGNADSMHAYRRESVEYYYTDPAGRASASGSGSNLGAPTDENIRFLERTIKAYAVQTMVDVPCGDVNWQFGGWRVDSLRGYVGLDILARLLRLNEKRFAFHSNKIFARWDVSSCVIPQVQLSESSGPSPPDLVHMRYLLQHLTLTKALAVLINVAESGARLLAVTTYPSSVRGNSTRNPNLEQGKETHFYMNDLDLPHYSMPPPLTCSKHGEGKHSPGLLCLYDMKSVRESGWVEKVRRTRIVGAHRSTRFMCGDRRCR